MSKSEDVGVGRSLGKVGQSPQAVSRTPDAARPKPRRLPGAAVGDDRQRSPKMLTPDGLEIIAMLVVMGLFIKVLEQFGMFEPVGGEGNGTYGRSVALLTIAELHFKGSVGVWCVRELAPGSAVFVPSGTERAAVLSDGLDYSSATQPHPGASHTRKTYTE